MHWCEDNLCAWITAPANTYSNLAYILFGIIMIQHARKLKSKTLLLFGPASIITGVSSFAFHASYTYLFQIFDYFGMFCFVYLAIVVQLRRLNVINAQTQTLTFWSLVIFSTILVPILGHYKIPYQVLVLGLVFLTMFMEMRLYVLSKRKGVHTVANYRYFIIGLLFLIGGATCSGLDAARVWCDPTNHVMNGHAMWHLLTSVGLFAFFIFYKQFAWDQGMQGLPVIVGGK